MKPFLFAFVLLVASTLSAQTDTMPQADEDQILQRIEMGTPSEYTYLPLKKNTNASALQKRDCLYYSGDSLFTGLMRNDVSDSLYTLAYYRNGKPTGEELTMRRFTAKADFTFERYTCPLKSDSTRLYFIAFYADNRTKAEGCTYFTPCKNFESFFGSTCDDRDYRSFYENGKPMENYTVDGPNRYEATYYMSGQLKEFRQTNRFNRPCGTWKQYDETGKQTGKLTFRKGTPKGSWDGKRVTRDNKT